MATNIIVKKTHEISDELWAQIVDGFNESFGLHATINGVKNGWYVANPWGYAYHAMAMDENDELMAYNVFTPAQYENGLTVVVSGSTFVRKKFRKNVMLFASLIKALRKRCLADGFDIEVGVPNHNSLDYHCKLNKVKMVKDLPYFVLPIVLSKTVGIKLPRLIDAIWSLLVRCHLAANVLWSCLFNGAEKDRKYAIATNDEFYRTRFQKNEYTSVVKGCYRFVYRMYSEDGKRVAYLMDFREEDKKSYKALVTASRYIRSHEQVDAILYVGFMHFKQCFMVKLPEKMAPKRLPLTCYVLNKENEQLYYDITDPDKWNFSLMSFDVR